MISALISVVGLLATGAEPTTLKPGVQLSFRGGVIELRRDRAAAAAPNKSFDLTLLVSAADDAGLQLFWLTDERGQGGWPWLERFGRLHLDAKHKVVGDHGPALLYDYGSGKQAIPLLVPFLATDTPPAAGARWQQDGLEYEVDATKELADRETWQIEVQNNTGPKRTLWLEKGSPLVVGCDERLFMDKGTEYQLQMRLVAVDELSDDELRGQRDGFGSLMALRSQLKRAPGSQADELEPADLKLLGQRLPELEKAILKGPISKLVRDAERELGVQTGRADAVAKLGGQHVGQPVEKFSITGLGPEGLDQDALAGHITVLHFWDYRDEPLKEPYGQVGYLEFLHNRRKADGVRVYGVAVDGRLKSEQTRRAAMNSVRKLTSFMNLTYPVLLDDGTLLKQFGDPRLLGAALPLVVVIGPDGKIAHYHVGFYQVDRQDGLKELDEAVTALLKR
jgi:alkyl hydroperoxide reductase subunit AhpC